MQACTWPATHTPVAWRPRYLARYIAKFHLFVSNYAALYPKNGWYLAKPMFQDFGKRVRFVVAVATTTTLFYKFIRIAMFPMYHLTISCT